jgi:hypothetical protein
MSTFQKNHKSVRAGAQEAVIGGGTGPYKGQAMHSMYIRNVGKTVHTMANPKEQF